MASNTPDLLKPLLSPKCYYKTQLCRDFLTSPYGCPSGCHCGYAHGEHELRVAQVPTYKTKHCHRLYKDGYCKYGERCIFIHPCDMLDQSASPGSPNIVPTDTYKALKTKTCHRMINYGFCSSGDSCPFTHPDQTSYSRDLTNWMSNAWSMNTSLSSISPSLSATSQLSTGSLEASSPAHSLDGNQSAWIASWTKNGFVSSSEALGMSSLAGDEVLLNVVESVLDESKADESETVNCDFGKGSEKKDEKFAPWNTTGTEASWWM